MTAPEQEKHWQVAAARGLQNELSPPRRWRTGSPTPIGRGALAGPRASSIGSGSIISAAASSRRPTTSACKATRPTHPELLDWLAGELIRNGWRLKPMHKLIMTSARPYHAKQSARSTQTNAKTRSRKHAVSGGERRAAGSGDRFATACWPSAASSTARCSAPARSTKATRAAASTFMIKRSKLVPMMQLFDQPEPLVSVGNRPSTTIAPQALLVHEQSRRSAAMPTASASDSRRRMTRSPRVRFAWAISPPSAGPLMPMSWRQHWRFCSPSRNPTRQAALQTPIELALADSRRCFLSLTNLCTWNSAYKPSSRQKIADNCAATSAFSRSARPTGSGFAFCSSGNYCASRAANCWGVQPHWAAHPRAALPRRINKNHRFTELIPARFREQRRIPQNHELASSRLAS